MNRNTTRRAAAIALGLALTPPPPAGEQSAAPRRRTSRSGCTTTDGSRSSPSSVPSSKRSSGSASPSRRSTSPSCATRCCSASRATGPTSPSSRTTTSEHWSENGAVAPVDIGDKTSEYLPAALDGFTYDGALNGLPLAIENIGFFYNTDLVETPPATWEEVREVGAALVDSGDGRGRHRAARPDVQLVPDLHLVRRLHLRPGRRGPVHRPTTSG